MEIVITEEHARGWSAVWVGSWAKEKELGCDLLSTPPDGGPPHPVEVKAWGEPFLDPKGRWNYQGQDIRTSQFSAALLDDRYRVEIVANVDAHLAGSGEYERLSLSAVEVVKRAVPRLYDVPLAGLEGRIRVGAREPPRPDVPRVIDWPTPEPGPGMESEDAGSIFRWPGDPPALTSAELLPNQVPSDNANWAELCWFAATLDGYELVGDELLGQLANTVQDYFVRLGFVPPALELDLLRACLFFEYRRHHHFGHAPDASSTRYVRALVREIRRASEKTSA